MTISKDCFKYLAILNLTYLILFFAVCSNIVAISGGYTEYVIKFTFIIGIILLIWFSYKYFSKSSYTRKTYKQKRNRKTILKYNTNNYLIISLVLLIGIVLVSDYIKEISVITQYFDIPIFIVATVLIAKGTWFLMKRIDEINLESDLSCWGLRIMGAGLCIMGIIIIFVIPMTLIMASYELKTEIPSYLYISIFAILGLAMIIVGTFTEFRSFRRYGYFVYMR